jgi:hypothetical protein
MNDDEYKEIQENTNDEELNYANTLVLQKELYNLKELKKELQGLDSKVLWADSHNINRWLQKYIEISKETNLTQHNYYVEQTNKFFEKQE